MDLSDYEREAQLLARRAEQRVRENLASSGAEHEPFTVSSDDGRVCIDVDSERVIIAVHLSTPLARIDKALVEAMNHVLERIRSDDVARLGAATSYFAESASLAEGHSKELQENAAASLARSREALLKLQKDYQGRLDQIRGRRHR
jgi:hypothetical protein